MLPGYASRKSKNSYPMKSAYSHTLGLLLAASLLAACAPMASRPRPGATCPPPPERALDEHGMVGYRLCLDSLTPAGLAREYEGVSRHYGQTGSGADRIKLALLLSVPGTPFHSTAAARKVLEAPGQNGAPAGKNVQALPAELGGLAQLLGASLARQQALEDRVQSLEKDLAAEKQRSDALQAQIDSVKNLERDMTRREAR
jgi:hypothetical protein